MGFIVNTPVEVWPGGQFDSFYVRVEQVILNKQNSKLQVYISHYASPETAKKASSEFIETDDGPNALSVSMSLLDFPGTQQMWSYNHEFMVTSKKTVNVNYERVQTEYEQVEYIDFDDEGNEIVAVKWVPYEVMVTGSEDVEYTRRDIDKLNKHIYEHTYDYVKPYYANIVGSENIIDIK